MNPVQINKRYRLEEKTGFGSFGTSVITCVLSISTHNYYTGEVYLTHNILSGQEVVIKLKPAAGEHYTLEHKLHVYKKVSGGIGMPCIHWFGFNVMAIDCLGLSLEDLFIHCHFQFTVQTVLLLAHQLVSQSS